MSPYAKANYADALLEFLGRTQGRCYWRRAEEFVFDALAPEFVSKNDLLETRRWLRTLGLIIEKGQQRITFVYPTPLGKQLYAVKEGRLDYLMKLAKYGQYQIDITLARLLCDFRGMEFRFLMNDLAMKETKDNISQKPVKWKTENGGFFVGASGVSEPSSFHGFFPNWGRKY